MKTETTTKDINFEDILQSQFSLSQFRVGQKEIISAILEKNDVLAVLPTGGGKSLCYQFPAVWTKKLVVVISPLIALMRDQVLSLQKMKIPSGCIHSGQSEDDKRQVFSEIQKGGTYILYLSPERAQKEGFQNWIRQKDIALFAIDEAHCVSQWGHDFREEYSQLSVLKQIRPDVPILALTASATPAVLSDISRQLNLHNPQKKVHGFYRPNLYYQVETCKNDDEKKSYLLQGIRQTPEGRIIVYCGTRKITEEVSQFLKSSFPEISEQIGFYHAGLSSEKRTNTQLSYANDNLRILVATNAFGMGIDQPDVRLVVHYQMPANIDSLYQEMGRAGRDGKDSTCLMLYSSKDKGLQSYFIQSSDAPQPIKNSRWRTLEALVHYSEGGECRHAEILTYYKDSQRITNCGHCDSCVPLSHRKIQRPSPTVRLITSVEKIKKALSKSKNKEKTIGKNTEQSLAKTKSGKLNLADVALDEKQESRFQVLRQWRRQKSIELDQPAFVVFSDQTLKHLAIENPQSLDELKNIYGIGENKLEKFGWDILAELKGSD
jgi:ATP-dependent DNA helicase RecQ